MTQSKKRYPLSENSSGRTMIEVLIAMAIFSIGFIAVSGMVMSTTRNNTTANIITLATMLAREKIEYLKSLPIQQMQAQCAEDLEAEDLDGTFTRACEVRASFSETVKVIKVTVSWKGRSQNREVVLKTLTRGNGA